MSSGGQISWAEAGQTAGWGDLGGFLSGIPRMGWQGTMRSVLQRARQAAWADAAPHHALAAKGMRGRGNEIDQPGEEGARPGTRCRSSRVVARCGASGRPSAASLPARSGNLSARLSCSFRSSARTGRLPRGCCGTQPSKPCAGQLSPASPCFTSPSLTSTPAVHAAKEKGAGVMADPSGYGQQARHGAEPAGCRDRSGAPVTPLPARGRL